MIFFKYIFSSYVNVSLDFFRPAFSAGSCAQRCIANCRQLFRLDFLWREVLVSDANCRLVGFGKFF